MAKQNATEQPVVNHQAPEGFVEIDIDLPSFKAELFTQRRQGQEIEDYTGGPIQGLILACRDFGEATDPETGQVITDEDGVPRRQRALMIELEKPLMVQGRDKSQPAFEAKPGEKILFFPTTKILQAILAVAPPPPGVVHLDMGAKVELACNSSRMIRIWVLPTTRTKHPTNPKFRIWNYQVKVDPKTHVRSGAQAAAALTGLYDQVHVMGAANGRADHVLPAAQS